MNLPRALSSLVIVASTLLSSACSQFMFFVANAPTVVGPYKRVSNLKYGADPRQSLDVYVPNKANKAPVVVFWYGGAWTAGDKESYRFVGAALAEHGFVAVLADYRLAPRTVFPDFMADGAHAVAWVQQHAAQYGGDPERIVLMGHSAGAYIASFLAVNPTYLKSANAKSESIRGLVGLSGPYALVPNTDSLNMIFAAPYTTKDWQPVHYVTKDSPPALLIHGANDDLVLPYHAEEMRDALTRAGVPVQAEFWEGRGHADTVAAFAWAARNRGPALQDTVKFIERVTSFSPSTFSQAHADRPSSHSDRQQRSTHPYSPLQTPSAQHPE